MSTSLRIARAARILATPALVATGLLACTTENPGFTPPEAPCEAGLNFYLQEYRVANPERVDILFVVDNGPGMLPAQQALGRAMPDFVASLQALEGLDWQIGVTSTDAGTDRGQLLTGLAGQPGCPGDRPRLIRRATAEAGEVARCNVVLGEAGDRFPQAFRTARLAIEDASSGFSREDARLVVVFFSQQDDCTIGDGFDRGNPDNCALQADRLFSLRDFQNYFAGRTPRNRDGNPVSVVAITGPPGPAGSTQPVCTGLVPARAGNRYAALESFGRLARHSALMNICANDFRSHLDDVIRIAVDVPDNALCPAYRLAAAPTSVVLRESSSAEIAATLSAFGDLLFPGPTPGCAAGEIAVASDALRGDLPRRIEITYCSAEGP